MESDDDSWVLFLSSGLLLVVVGILFLGDVRWYIQYGVLASGLLLCGFSVNLTR